MSFNIFICQAISTIAFISMCNLILFPLRRNIYAIYLYSYIAFCCLIVAPFIGQSGTPIMLLGSSLILLLFSKINRFYNLILFQSIWFLSLLTDYILSILFRLLGYDFNRMRASFTIILLFSLLHALLCVLPCYFLGRRLRRGRLFSDGNIIPDKIQKLLFTDVTICSCIFLFNIFFGSLNNYPTEILLFNGVLILSFSAANFIIFLILYRTLQENKRLELRTQEQEKLTEHMIQLENHYQEIRRYKHDYMNILSTINGYLQEGDLEKLKNYFDLRLGSVNRLMFNNDATIAKLALIRALEIKGLLYTKLIQAMNLDLNVSLELTQEFFHFPVNMLTLTRILGIFLDNAMEAAVLTKERRFHIAILQKDQKIIFHIENSTLPLPQPLECLMKEGFTTKENHSGIGLSTVSMLLDSIPEISHRMLCENGLMKQILVIPAKEKNT